VSEHVVVRVTGIEADLTLVNALANLHVMAKRFGWTLEIAGAGAELRELLDLVGLAELCR
jgi:hypothetical protein